MKPASITLPPIVVETARAVHAAMERRIGPMPKACHAGCSACCHQIVDALNWEASLVTDFIAQEMPTARRDRAREQAEAWLRTFNAITRAATPAAPLRPEEVNAARVEFRRRRVACPFLIDGQCTIYPVRPVVCRSHIVETDPEACARDIGRVGTEAARQVAREEVRAFDPAIHPLSGMPLVLQVAGALGVRQAVKPLLVPVRRATPAAPAAPHSPT